jgi:hypothetical protein
MENKIEVSKHVFFDTECGRFALTNEAQEMVCRGKNLICSYSGSCEWIHHFVCEMIDFCSGSSIYNYAIGAVRHETRIPELWKNRKDYIIEWVKNTAEKPWGKKMYELIDRIIDEAEPA